ncbi:transposase [Streptomyces chartreusis]|uniref:transposase n=1 Tax=Streptomyces chartreusis TaxID=1969 RepID=UPI003809CF90
MISVWGLGDLSEEPWSVRDSLLPVAKLGRPLLGRRKLIDGIRWRARTGAQWRDLSVEYGPWQTSMDSSAAGIDVLDSQQVRRRLRWTGPEGVARRVPQRARGPRSGPVSWMLHHQDPSGMRTGLAAAVSADHRWAAR